MRKFLFSAIFAIAMCFMACTNNTPATFGTAADSVVVDSVNVDSTVVDSVAVDTVQVDTVQVDSVK